jgi:RND family efflux transporter MFP subunit
MPMLKKILRFVLPIVVVALGVGVFRFLVATRPTAPRAQSASTSTPVRVMRVSPGRHDVVVTGHGVVAPAREVAVQSELNGRVVARHPDLVPGGVVAAGETLVRIDPRDFRTAIAQQSAQAEAQRVAVQTEERRRAVAEREWELLARQSETLQASPEGRALALREPQLRSAQASAAATDAQLAQARLTLSRTTLRAPFRALVREADVEVGQLVGPTARLGTLVDAEVFWVQVSLPLEAVLPLVRTGPSGPAIDAAARVVQEVGARTISREGRVVRLLGDLDPMGRMARVLVEIRDPLGLDAPDPSGLPMLLGAYVRVEIDAGSVEGAHEIPRTALRSGDTVWVLEGGALAIREVTVAWRREDTVLVSSGLSDGEQLVTSALAAPVPGMPLRDAAAPAPAPAATPSAAGAGGTP